ncbi:N-terminal glutamine amidase-domain-containing protein [Fimicolochytrium jonesii]|uniref:N-terminal glutamine amidase-domain-containing protein n=1 Tax=Fimicolochytrium jonesii TaxID=1396493 RepID=UPI0022FE116D|nr:N-terminal glutamine amidase-domain-containing protein [Fimicolochytrium jonesii]KAI8818365.1 N-terminal glutamine amidase-domain-containing protein [Fimicolochytrium jonesii]
MDGQQQDAGRLYTRCYCEENVYNLVRFVKELPQTSSAPDFTDPYAKEIVTFFRANQLTLSDVHVVFVSSDLGWVDIAKQKAGQPPRGAVIWDYHVFAIAVAENRKVVFDFDSTLGFPADLPTYIEESFPHTRLPCSATRKFRVVSGEQYLAFFSSDRRHMKKTVDGMSTWSATPPTHALIRSHRSELIHAQEQEYDREWSKCWGPAHTAPVDSSHTLPLYIRMPPDGAENGGICSSNPLGEVTDLEQLIKFFE